MSETEALIREIIEMERMVQFSLRDRWRWVLSADALALLRECARLLGGEDIPDAEVRVFDMPVRIDEAAVHPMLELRGAA